MFFNDDDRGVAAIEQLTHSYDIFVRYKTLR